MKADGMEGLNPQSFIMATIEARNLTKFTRQRIEKNVAFGGSIKGIGAAARLR